MNTRRSCMLVVAQILTKYTKKSFLLSFSKRYWSYNFLKAQNICKLVVIFANSIGTCVIETNLCYTPNECTRSHYRVTISDFKVKYTCVLVPGLYCERNSICNLWSWCWTENTEQWCLCSRDGTWKFLWTASEHIEVFKLKWLFNCIIQI